MNTIQLQIQAYLEQVNRGEAAMPSSIVEEAARQFKRSLERQFNPRPKKEFGLRMSSVGKPVCRLWYEKSGAPEDPQDYSFPMKMAFGDATEIILLAIIRAANIDVDAINEAGEITVEGTTIRGTSDITINNEVWDIKSASKWAFDNKYNSKYGYKNLKENDDFGYIAQGVGYSVALDKKFAGWIAVCKDNGEIATLEIPDGDLEADKDSTMQSIARTVRLLESKEFPGREFQDEAETFRKRETGNRVLQKVCEYCPFKRTCWPEAKYMPSVVSTAADKPYKWYTHIATTEET